MPIREFCCSSCGRIFEELIRHENEEKNLVCPNCGSSGIRRVFSVFGVAGTEKKVHSSGNSCSHCSSHKCSSCS
ncbi:MAG: FmdB family zinc ribbon protein [bacterium]